MYSREYIRQRQHCVKLKCKDEDKKKTPMLKEIIRTWKLKEDDNRKTFQGKGGSKVHSGRQTADAKWETSDTSAIGISRGSVWNYHGMKGRVERDMVVERGSVWNYHGMKKGRDERDMVVERGSVWNYHGMKGRDERDMVVER